jgi:hypothetical protein
MKICKNGDILACCSLVQKPSEPQMLRHCFRGHVFSIPRNSTNMTAGYEKKQMLTTLQKIREKLMTLYGIKPNKLAQRITLLT